MPKSLDNPHDLVEADFRELQILVSGKHGKEFSVEYIRKVCKEKRKNPLIIAMAWDYINLKKEVYQKVEAELAKLTV